MIKYICRHCDDLVCETSVCPICGARTEVYDSSIYYDIEANVPVYTDKSQTGTELKKIGTDVRPVFARERLLVEALLGTPMAFAGKSVWSTASGIYFIDGKKRKIDVSKACKSDIDSLIRTIHDYAAENQKYVDDDLTNEYILRFIELNRYRLDLITDDACNYIQDIASGYGLSAIFCSFSGGKDSTVVSSLVRRALGREDILHIYGDTTLEYPASAEYLSRFRKENPKTPVLVAKNQNQDFEDLCNVVGPPSRVLRWCCTVFKTGAITKKIDQMFRNEKRILSFQGIRRSESVSRSKYDKDSDNSKIAKQTAASPVIDWLDFDIWLYILGNHISFNEAYRQGFTRVGCWCCPNNSLWSELLSSVYMPEEYKKWKELLYSFAQKVGKEDWKDYIDNGNWKARQGGNGLEYSKNTVVNYTPCVLEDNAYNFELTRPITEDLYTYFKPFGTLNFEMGNKRLNEVFVLNRKDGKPLLKLTGRIGSKKLKVTVVNQEGQFRIARTASQLINGQITKFQTCIACGYCQSVCKFNALKVMNKEKGHVSNETIAYSIDTDRCVGCLECVKHFDAGCYMKKVLRLKIGE